MCFNLHRIPSVILFFPFWSFQSLRQNCRGLSQSGSSLSGALSEKERKSAGQSETFALTQAQPPQPALVASLGFWQTWRVSYFHMDELYSTTSSVYQEPKSVDIENKVFSFQLFRSPVFKGDLFFMAGAMDLCLPLHRGLPWSSSGISETVPGISGVWVGIGAFWLNILNLREPLYSRKVFLVTSGQQIQSQRQMVLRFGGTAQRMALFVARIPPKMTFES